MEESNDPIGSIQQLESGTKKLMSSAVSKTDSELFFIPRYAKYIVAYKKVRNNVGCMVAAAGVVYFLLHVHGPQRPAK